MRVRSILAACTVGATAALVSLAPPALGQQAGPVLDTPLNGEAAVSALGEELPEVAQLNRKSAADLKASLRKDRTLWLDKGGRLHAKDDHLPEGPPEAAPEQGPFPDDATFRLNSRPGASRTLFLDFDGHVVTGTAWNSSYGVTAERQPAWDIDGSPSTWSRTEIDTIQSIYLRVAEDFAPFEVNVTTQDPGDDALHRSGSADPLYGSRVLLSPAVAAQNRICPSGCGGVAYIGTHNSGNSAAYQPAWVFPNSLGNGAKSMAEAVSHEAGHNLGLNHDGSTTAAYYSGHGNWAPIMGIGYYNPLVQWSRGEYPGANNTQDDLATIQAYGLPLRTDDHGSTIAAARSIGTAASATGVLETGSDRDVFALARDCTSSMRVSVDPAGVSPNADLRLRVLDGDGRVLGENDQTHRRIDGDTLNGLSAVVTVSTGPGTYYAEVDGVGAGDLATGSSDYGSLGAYRLGVSGCATTTPSSPTSAAAYEDPAGRTATLSWAPPAGDGGSPITGYRVSRDGTDDGGGGPWSTVLPASARSQTFTQLVPGRAYRLSVQAVNAAGAGPAATVVTTLPAEPVGSTYVPLTPKRVLDTRTGVGAPQAKVGPRGTVQLQVTGPDGSGLAPVGSTAVALNVTATEPTGQSYVSVYPSGAPDGPGSSNLNVTAGVTVPNLVVSRVAADGTVTLYNDNGSVSLIADLQGAYVPDDRGSTYRPLDPRRLLDTRGGVGAPRTPVGPGGTLELQVTGPEGSGLAPFGSTAVVLNVTATNPTETGFVSVYASGLSNRPTSSNLNLVAGQTTPNLVIAQVGPDGRVVLYNANGTVDLLADLQGAYVDDAGGHRYTAGDPRRVLDTRSGLGAPAAKVGPAGTLVLQVTGPPGSGLAPVGSSAVVLNVTATDPTTDSYVSAYPTGYGAGPSSSNLNVVAGQTVPNLVVARVSAGGTVTLYNHAGSVHLVADLQGAYGGGTALAASDDARATVLRTGAAARR